MPETFNDRWHRKALRGQQEAVDALAQTAIGPLYRFCFYRLGGNRHLTEEVVQETLVRAIRELEKYEPDLAWDYVTSPLATEEEPSLNLAPTYHRQGLYGLADRAYELACAADPSNAELVWNRARCLIEAGDRVEARPLLETLAAGTWNAEYEQFKTQARRALAAE